MVLINQAAKEITAKIVYYGPGLCGKTTNLIKIFETLPDAQKGKMLSLATKQDRTLFFDLLPVDAGKVKGQRLRFQLYTVPGQVFYNETRKMVLKNADGVVFVADSQQAMLESNRESFANLMDNLRHNDIDPENIPILVQFNKRDLPNILPVEDLRKDLKLEKYPFTEGSAFQGKGVMDTYHSIAKLILKKLKGKDEDVVGSLLAEAKAKTLEETHPPVSKEKGPIPMPLTLPNYDKIEEVSLESLIEERKRVTAIMTSPPPHPPRHGEEAEELPLSALVEEPGSSRAAFEDTQIRLEEPLEFEVEGGFSGEDLATVKATLIKIRRLVDELIKKLP
jgi:hypothetical protein